MTEQMPEVEAQESGKRGIPRMLIVIPLVLVVAAALYGFGLRQGRAQLDAVRADYEERLAVADRALTAAERDIAVLRNVKNLLQAEETILRSGVELDRRNFGTANDRLRSASAILGRVRDPAGGVSLQELTLLREDLDKLDINVAVNLEEQRGRVLSLADRLSDLIPDVAEGSPAVAGAPAGVEPPPAE